MKKYLGAVYRHRALKALDNIHYSRFHDGLRRRATELLADPCLVDQGQLGLCSYASITYLLLQQSPETFVRFLDAIYSDRVFDPKFGAVHHLYEGQAKRWGRSPANSPPCPELDFFVMRSLGKMLKTLDRAVYEHVRPRVAATAAIDVVSFKEGTLGGNAGTVVGLLQEVFGVKAEVVALHRLFGAGKASLNSTPRVKTTFGGLRKQTFVNTADPVDQQIEDINRALSRAGGSAIMSMNVDDRMLDWFRKERAGPELQFTFDSPSSQHYGHDVVIDDLIQVNGDSFVVPIWTWTRRLTLRFTRRVWNEHVSLIALADFSTPHAPVKTT